MTRFAPNAPQMRPRQTATVAHDGREYPLILEPSGWRLRSRSKKRPVSFRTGTTSLGDAKAAARKWLEENLEKGIVARKGGGSLAKLVELYEKLPKRTQKEGAYTNVCRLRTICRVALGRTLDSVTVREVGPALWETYQRKVFEKHERAYELTTRYRENIAINSAVRTAKAIFIPALLAKYREAGFDPRPDATQCAMLPEPYVPPSKADAAGLAVAWGELASVNRPLWLAVGLALFAGMRREEITSARAGWIEERAGMVVVALRDRPEEKFWTKTGKPYTARVIDPALAEWLREKAVGAADAWLVPEPASESRRRWFERAPQSWLREHGITAQKPLHRLRGLYADAVARLEEDAFAARLAGVKEAQKNLGHTTSATTEKSYLTPQP